jgi:hypothetical protein
VFLPDVTEVDTAGATQAVDGTPPVEDTESGEDVTVTDASEE